ncbi:hypothetical protein [Clostridium sp. MD294]|uniref:hypothetical protein n=1 Tax=Clostridium sp. MD294 TaxID=97138 RepID=UPI0002C91636|nr:hypothetical protein [Clostridium sp. MD294]NDO47605.1 hypothetical protein [Clostridium sp. MD294]USF30077.1 hypothetical protein C820_001501 [Clostridium sp. MD294]
MRKILLLLTSVMMVLGMAACGGGGGEEKQDTNTPEAAVAGYLDAFKAVDQAKINEYVAEDDMMYSEDTEEDISEAQIVFGNITYEIKSVNTDTEGVAIVTTDITNIDMTAVMQSLMTAAMTESGDIEAMDEEKSMEMLKQAIEDNKDNTITKTVDIELTQVEDKWKVKSTDELVTVLSGGIAPTF